MEDNVQDYIRVHEKRAILRELVDHVRNEFLPLGGTKPRSELEAVSSFGSRVVSQDAYSDVIAALLHYDEQLEEKVKRFTLVERNVHEPELEEPVQKVQAKSVQRRR